MFSTTIKNIVLLQVFLGQMLGNAWGRAYQVSSAEFFQINRIARAINSLQPRLDEPKYLEFATGIYRAARAYSIDPFLLVSIANRETSFRENLPEGAAGELGICQIRKMWINNRYFRAEFKTAKQSDLLRPAKNFMFAAWILADLKKRGEKGTLPSWAFYNSVKFVNRLKYFIPVNRDLSTIRKEHGHWTWGTMERPAAQLVLNDVWKPSHLPLSKHRRIAEAKENNWVAAALDKLQVQDQKRKSNGKKLFAPDTLRATADRDVRTYLIKASLND